MEDLFRFMLIRPPTETDSDDSVDVDRGTDFVKDLREAVDGQEPAAAVRDVARRFVAAGYVDAVEKLRLGSQLRHLTEALAKAGPVDELVTTDVAPVIENAMGAPASAVVTTAEFGSDRDNASDAVIAIKILKSEHAKPLARIVRALRHLRLIERMADGDETLDQPGGVAAVLAAPLRLPAGIFPLPKPDAPAPDEPEKPEDTALGRQLNEALEQSERLRSAVSELTLLEPLSLVEDPQQGPDETLIGGAPRDGLIQRSLRFFGFTRRPVETFSGSLRPPQAPERMFALKQEAAERLSVETRTVLKDERLSATEMPIDRLVNKLDMSFNRRLETVAQLESQLRKRNVALIGTTLVHVPQDFFPWFPPQLPKSAPGVPTTCGSVQPVGVADLLLVQQELKCYQAREVAHIENVLKGEQKEREHKRTITSEEFLLTEEETTTEEERELESTERFEMQREANETIRQDASLEAGLKVSGKYGIAVEFESHVNAAVSNSKERSTRRATEYSSEITSRSASKITTRFKQQRTLRITREVEETNRHKLDNVDGDDHVVGIYQWVEKVYEAQVFNYGLRTMYEFMVPEPAAFLIHALKQNYSETTGLEKPADFTLKPNQLNETNYHSFIRLYEATGVKPPPEPFVTIAKTFRAGPDAGESATRGSHVDAAELIVLDGYRAIYGHAVLAGMNWWDARDTWSVDFSIGRKRHRFSHATSWSWGTTLNSETAAIPVAVETYRAMQFALGLEIKCQRTALAFKEWQQVTHSALLQAYQKKRSEYEEKLTELQVQAGIEIAGQSPGANRALEKDEFKKACVSLLTRQHFDAFDSIESSDIGLPQLNLDEAEEEGSYIRFFEQAFEWENMTYVLYPYFWGRKESWIERISYDDADPLFVAFLKAGAARVVVPARLNFEPAIDHFMNTCEIWGGGELPDITNELYVPIVQELREQLGAPDNEVPQGDPWDVTLPTSLVYLRQQRSLPKWEKNEEGEWEPVPQPPPGNGE